MWVTSCPASFVEKILLSLLNCFGTLSQIIWLFLWGSVSVTLISVHQSTLSCDSSSEKACCNFAWDYIKYWINLGRINLNNIESSSSFTWINGDITHIYVCVCAYICIYIYTHTIIVYLSITWILNFSQQYFVVFCVQLLHIFKLNLFPPIDCFWMLSWMILIFIKFHFPVTCCQCIEITIDFAFSLYILGTLLNSPTNHSRFLKFPRISRMKNHAVSTEAGSLLFLILVASALFSVVTALAWATGSVDKTCRGWVSSASSPSACHELWVVWGCLPSCWGYLLLFSVYWVLLWMGLKFCQMLVLHLLKWSYLVEPLYSVKVVDCWFWCKVNLMFLEETCLVVFCHLSLFVECRHAVC